MWQHRSNICLSMITQKFSLDVTFSSLHLTFFLAGDIMSRRWIVKKKTSSFADSFVGWISGGISLVSIVACTFFAAISGSSVATTAAIGGLMYQEMVKRISNYSAAYRP